jgi:N-acetylglutamate synthase-like GNAT family acetyltransferase
LNQFAEQRLLLPRTVEDILEKIRNFKVAEHNGVFMGCCALRNYGGSLYEVRSLAIVPE